MTAVDSARCSASSVFTPADILLCHLDAETALPELGFLVDWTHDYLHDSLAQLRLREQSGAVRECHGDLHARNVVRWGGRLVPGADRRLFRDLAVRAGFLFIILACEADPAVLTERVQKRGSMHGDPSDAGMEVLDRQLQNRQPLSADEQSAVIVADTTEPQACQNAFAAIQDRMASMSSSLPSAWANGGCR